MDQVTSWAKRALRVAWCFSLLLFILTLGVSGAASALLLDRGPNLVYDDVLDITWVRDATLCVTLDNCVNRDDTFNTGGMTWADANTWAANLVYQGFSDWRLPYASVAAGAGPTIVVYPCQGDNTVADELGCRDNEMAYMFYYNLDGNILDNKTGNQTAVGGEELTGIQPEHWFGTASGFIPAAWVWSFAFGFGDETAPESPFSAWAVRAGDVVATAPEPGILALVALAALALALVRSQGARRP